MNIVEAFVDYLEEKEFGTLGTDIFISSVPQEAPDKCFWLISAGGSPQDENATGEMIKSYIVSLYYRNTDAKDVYDILHNLEVLINSNDCTQLTDFDTIDLRATAFPIDQDIDNEDRTVGLLQITIDTYYKE